MYKFQVNINVIIISIVILVVVIKGAIFSVAERNARYQTDPMTLISDRNFEKL